MTIGRFIIALSALTWAGAARAEVMEVGADGSLKVLRDAPDATWSNGEQETAAIPAEATVIPDVAVTVLKDNGWSGQYAKAMVEIARANDISPHLLEAVVWQESRWNPGAISRAGAIGLAQLMPGTARDLGVDPRDPIRISRVARGTFASSSNRFDGDVEKALAAYNAGPGRVMTAGGIPSIPETQAYVRAIVARLALNSIQRRKHPVKIVKATVALVAAAMPGAALAQANPQGSGPIVAALGVAAGHAARQRRHRGRGDGGRRGRLHDADRPAQLALRRDRDHRLLHPVRRGLDRRRHPVGRGGLG